MKVLWNCILPLTLSRPLDFKIKNYYPEFEHLILLDNITIKKNCIWFHLKGYTWQLFTKNHMKYSWGTLDPVIASIFNFSPIHGGIEKMPKANSSNFSQILDNNRNNYNFQSLSTLIFPNKMVNAKHNTDPTGRYCVSPALKMCHAYLYTVYNCSRMKKIPLLRHLSSWP